MVKKALLGQIGDTEIRLLRIFKAVVACGGLAAAELELNIGRSTISRHLRDLEERLGLVLCRRGRAHIGAAVRDFRRTAPEVALEMTIGSLTDIESAVIDGRIDVGVAPDHRRSDSLSYTPLFDEEMLLYCGRQHPLFEPRDEPLSWDELRDYDHAGLGFHSPNMKATRRLGLRRQATVNDQEAIAPLILSGCYIGFLPDHYAETLLRNGDIRRVVATGSTYDVRFVAIQRRSPAPTRIGEAFLKCLREAHAGAS